MFGLANTLASPSVTAASASTLMPFPANNAMPLSESQRQEALDTLGCRVQSICSTLWEKFNDNHVPCRQMIDTSKKRLEGPVEVEEKFELCMARKKFCASKKFPTKDLSFQLKPCGKEAATSGSSLQCWGRPGYGSVVCEAKAVESPVRAVATEENGVGAINDGVQIANDTEEQIGQIIPENKEGKGECDSCTGPTLPLVCGGFLGFLTGFLLANTLDVLDTQRKDDDEKQTLPK